MTPHPLAFIAALATAVAVHAALDPAERNETFARKSEEKKEFPKERSSLEGSRNAAEEKIEFVTVPMTETKAGIPGIQKMGIAPIEMKARATPTRKPEQGSFSIETRPSSKFDKKSRPAMAAQFHDGMAEANRVKTSTLKPEGKRTVLDWINRFVFRRNEKPPAVTPAGEPGDSSEKAAPSGKSDSGRS